jgi:hypothetical protein
VYPIVPAYRPVYALVYPIVPAYRPVCALVYPIVMTAISVETCRVI